MTGQRTNVEYEEAPSGNVYFYQYKEPMMKFSGGFGFQGALIFDGDSDKIQCNFCGKWFDSLAPHLIKEHNMSAAEYKAAVGLNKGTALINEKTRTKLIASGLNKRLQNLRSRKGRKHSKSTRMKIAETLRQNRSEMQNIHGTCPEQLIDRLQKKYTELGRTPTTTELTFVDTLVKVYGSLKHACEIAGIPYRKPSQTMRTSYWTKARCAEFIKDYYDIHGNFPKVKELNKAMYEQIQKYGRKEIYRLALASDGKFRKTNQIMRYSKEELIGFLQNFERIHGRKPSYSDAKRGLLPHLSRYSYNFGSWKEALKLAFG